MTISMSRRSFVAYGFAGVTAVLSGSLLAGCATDPGYFIGTWEFSNTDEDGDRYIATLTVRSDKTWEFYQRFINKTTGATMGEDTETGIWKITGDTLLLLESETAKSAYHCTLDDDKTSLFFPMADGTKMLLRKQ